LIVWGFVLWPGLKKRVDMIGHDTDGEELVTRVVKMAPCVQDNRPSLRTQAAAMRGCDCHSVNRPRFFEMRKTAARELRRRCLLGFRKSSRWQNAIASTLQACVPQIFTPLKQWQWPAFLLSRGGS